MQHPISDNAPIPRRTRSHMRCLPVLAVQSRHCRSRRRPHDAVGTSSSSGSTTSISGSSSQVGIGAASLGIVLVVLALRHAIVITRQNITVRGVFITSEVPWSSHPRLMFSDAASNGGVLLLETGPGRVVRRRVGTPRRSEPFVDVLDVVAPHSVAVVGSPIFSDTTLTTIKYVCAAVAILFGFRHVCSLSAAICVLSRTSAAWARESRPSGRTAQTALRM